MEKNYFKLTKRVKTPDNWYGNYGENEDEVEVIFKYDTTTPFTCSGIFYPSKPFVSVTIWGNDDFALDITSDEEDLIKLLNLYYDIHDGVTQEWAYDHGMVQW